LPSFFAGQRPPAALPAPLTAAVGGGAGLRHGNETRQRKIR